MFRSPSLQSDAVK